jgi:hypothetical protein
LPIAVKNNNLAMVKLLAEVGALNYGSNTSILAHAIYCNYHEIVALFLNGWDENEMHRWCINLINEKDEKEDEMCKALLHALKQSHAVNDIIQSHHFYRKGIDEFLLEADKNFGNNLPSHLKRWFNLK